MSKLNEKEVQEHLLGLPGWQFKDGKLVRTFKLPSFAHTVLFIGAVGQLAEAAGHHPDLHLFGYNNLTIELSTHSVGGLTEKDFALAKAINSLPQKAPKK